MDAVPPAEFEMELRRRCDRMYERSSPPGNPMMKLMEGTLTLEEAHRFWGGHWDAVLVFNEITLPRLLERCPDLDGRVKLWNAIYPEYGRGQLSRAHPYLTRVFLQALGIPEARCPWRLDRSKPAVARQIARLEAMEWIEFLVFGFLGPETVGPKVFGLVEAAITRHFGIPKEQLRFFSVHYREDQRDSEIIFPLIARYAATADAQRRALDALDRFYNLERYLHYACALGPMDYSYVEAAGRAPPPPSSRAASY